MKKNLLIAASFVAALFVTVAVHSADKDKEEFKAKCPVSNREAKQEFAVDYKGGKAYFCCNNCPNAFKRDTKKFAAKANQQLVATGQAKQEKCPIAGRNLNPATEIEVAGTKVAFCCNNCKGRAERAEGDAQITLVFGDEAFEKGFKVAKKDEKDD
jgi:YHS domain-containing protein